MFLKFNCLKFIFFVDYLIFIMDVMDVVDKLEVIFFSVRGYMILKIVVICFEIKSVNFV